jgi:Protein of unknown function (DUF3551)
LDRGSVLRPRGTSRSGATTLSAVALAGIAFAATAACADEIHPWCMVYQEMSGAWSCAFASFEQCRTSAAGGNGGSCIRNPAYQAPPKPSAGALRGR